ncbi:peptidoglycan-binding domain-containing protein [Streptomyces sp. MMBL 11-3]|uniref:peptidoglycan-binding domain-containing protein n=1 Tax=Streptomyces sp. MMBL 11-3 TaxID=3382639 RepID=UPI0039B4F794
MSTPSDPQEPSRRPALEPTHVLRRRQPGSLADLLRQVQEKEGQRERDPDDEYEVVTVVEAASAAPSGPAEDDTQELPPVAEGANGAGNGGANGVGNVGGSGGESWDGAGDTAGARPVPRRSRPAGRGPAHGRTDDLVRRTALGAAAVAAALAGFGGALLLTWDRGAADAADAPPPAASTAPSASVPAPQGDDPDGPGTLREGDRGPAVSDLQQRLRRIPNVYDQGTPDGVYDATLRAAVARFQLWYGIRGDETGVYGNDTRLDLESRTAPGAAPAPGA